MRSKSEAGPARKAAGRHLKAASARRKNTRVASQKKATARTARRTIQPAKNGKLPRKPKATEREVAVNGFRRVVNISPIQLERWLDTPESKKLRRLEAGRSGLAFQGAGHLVLKILKKRSDKYSGEDLEYMRSVTSEITRRLAKRPKGNIIASNWRYALMNWGHDPSKPFKRTRGRK